MRRAAAAAVITVGLTAALSGCTSGVVSPSSTPPALTVASSKPSALASAPSTTSPYHLDIPVDDQKELFRWVSGERGGTVMFDDVRAGHRYRIEGGCIYGYDDKLTFRILGAPVGAMRDRNMGVGRISCDGQVHRQDFRATMTTPIELVPGRLGTKTVAYLRLLPARSAR